MIRTVESSGAVMIEAGYVAYKSLTTRENDN